MMKSKPFLWVVITGVKRDGKKSPMERTCQNVLMEANKQKKKTQIFFDMFLCVSVSLLTSTTLSLPLRTLTYETHRADTTSIIIIIFFKEFYTFYYTVKFGALQSYFKAVGAHLSDRRHPGSPDPLPPPGFTLLRCLAVTKKSPEKDKKKTKSVKIQTISRPRDPTTP